MGCCSSRSRRQPCAPKPPAGYRQLRTSRTAGAAAASSRGRGHGGDDDSGWGDGPGRSDIPTAKPVEPPYDKGAPTPPSPQPALGYPLPQPAYPQQPPPQPSQGNPPTPPTPCLYPQLPFEDRAIKPFPGPRSQTPTPSAGSALSSTQPARTGNMLNLLD